MLYVGIDQHAKQITVVVRNSVGEDVLRRQVNTRPEKIAAFFDQLAAMDGQFMAILETCGFNDWLVDELRSRNCAAIVLIHPERPAKKKTDTKEGSRLARFFLGQLVLHVLKRDARMREWYRRIKLRRGSKIARVAVMRRMATIFWHMLTYEEPYTIGSPPPRLRKRDAEGAAA
jgi:hypothetical protein